MATRASQGGGCHRSRTQNRFKSLAPSNAAASGGGWRDLAMGALALVLTLVAGLASARPVVSDIRVGEHPDMTRFVVDVSEAVAFDVFLLADPYRIVIDLPEVEWQLPYASGSQGAGDVERVRFDLFKAGTSRIVLDLRRPLDVVDTFILPGVSADGRRLVVDLKPTTREAFLALAGWPEAGETRRESDAVAKAMVERPPLRPVVVIDPGHGGKDPGAKGVSGTNEADVVLDMAKDLRGVLEDSERYNVVLTREKNVGIPLRERIAIARRRNADLFISLHADKLRAQSDVRGMSVYTLSKTASDDEAAALATKENQADVLLGIDLTDNSEEVNLILIDLAMRETMNRSAHFAKLLMPELAKSARLLKNTHRFAGFAVLKAPDVPSVLVELGYLSNAADEKNLISTAWRKGVATSMLAAIDGFFAEDELRQARRGEE